MKLNPIRVRQLLKAFLFQALFVEELGWDNHSANLSLEVNHRTFTLEAIAHKRGMVAYRCATEPSGTLPDHATRRKVEQQAAKTTHEHLIIYTDSAQTTQIWQWVKREAGKPAACREHTFHRDSSGDALIQKLEPIAFTLEEEEELTLTGVTTGVRKAFDVERVTKRFYDRFKKEHGRFLTFITGITDVADQEWYASVMMNRLMFVYFIQRKGFLNDEVDYLRNRLTRCQKERGRDQFYTFYRYFLIRLFHEGFGGKTRTPELEKLLGKIPYLNGGLFEQHSIEKNYPEIEIPDEAFEAIFDFFGEFQWHLDERALRNDNEINPDVLGYIFEKYINQKQMGAYYTKEDITEYIGKSTILPFILDTARAKCKVAFENPDGPTVWDLLRDDPDRYVYLALRHGVSWDIHALGGKGAPLLEPYPLPADIAAGLHPPTLHAPVGSGPVATLELRKGWNRPAPETHALPTETWREVVARRTRYEEVRRKLAAGEVREVNDLVTLNLDIRQLVQDMIDDCEGPDLLRALWNAITKVTILDPTCGSGAFLFAALNILEPLYEGCLDRMEGFVGDLDRSETKPRPEKFKDFREVLKTVAAHPNRRYFIFKSIILSNLYGVDIMEEAVEICKLRLFLKLAAQVEPNTQHPNLGIEPLPDIDFNVKAGNTLVGFATYAEAESTVKTKLDFDNAMEKISLKAADLQDSFDRFRKHQVEGDGTVPAGDKLKLRDRLAALQKELNDYLAAQYGINPKKPADYAAWLKSHQPFHWFIEFYGIMNSGGFDVIIGNPPYVEYRLVRGSYELLRNTYTSESAQNLYAFSMERACHLLKSTGRFGMIVPTSVMGLEETVSLRDVLLTRFTEEWCSTYAIRPSKLFDGVDQRLCIFLGATGTGHETQIRSTRYKHWNMEERGALFSLHQYAHSQNSLRLHRIPQLGSDEATSVFKKVELRCEKIAAAYKSASKQGLLMHYHRSPRYWIRAMDFEPHFKSATSARSVHHFRDLYFTDRRYGIFIGALLNSTLFFIWFVSTCNGRNITGTDLEQFPVGEVESEILDRSATLFARLMDDYNRNSFVRERQDCEFQEFRQSLSKPILDEIDTILAQHYGFTEEELDFIINYDIKYRMGRDASGEDE